MVTRNSSTNVFAAKSTGREPNTLNVACSPLRSTRANSCPCAVSTTEKAIVSAERKAVLRLIASELALVQKSVPYPCGAQSFRHHRMCLGLDCQRQTLLKPDYIVVR